MGERAYRKASIPELEHCYGQQVRIIAEPYLLTQLATVCSPTTVQPRINDLIENCYRHLLVHVYNREFPLTKARIETRMGAAGDSRGYYEGVVIDPNTRVVTVNIARAGTFPSHICFHMLNEFMNPAGVRQDHLIMERETDDQGRVTGAGIHGGKIGGEVENRVLIFPDPMAATGSSLIRAIDYYKQQVPGKPAKIINIHLIITPNYIRAMRAAHPDVVIYAIRVDRGASPERILETTPGSEWELEDGLDRHQYIIPGGGGFGEILNNSYV
ncbi:MAG: uracil phosphoribosyltransferase [Planctomycetota bacterium]